LDRAGAELKFVRRLIPDPCFDARAASRTLVDGSQAGRLVGQIRQIVLVAERLPEINDPEHHYQQYRQDQRELDEGLSLLAVRAAALVSVTPNDL
jgi:hypothetical protein